MPLYADWIGFDLNLYGWRLANLSVSASQDKTI